MQAILTLLTEDTRDEGSGVDITLVIYLLGDTLDRFNETDNIRNLDQFVEVTCMIVLLSHCSN